MNNQAGYFVGNLVLIIPWLVIFLIRKDLRREMIFGGIFALPLALTAPFFIPEYWNPPYLFGYLFGLPVGIEDVMFAIFSGGIAAVMFEFLEKKRLKKLKKSHLHLFPYLFFLALLIILEFIFPAYTIINLLTTGFLASLYMGMQRRDLIPQIITSGFLFMFLYLGLFLFFNLLFSSYIQEIYTLKNLFGISIWGIPLEEYMFAFFAGACWSVLYEFVTNYRTA